MHSIDWWPGVRDGRRGAGSTQSSLPCAWPASGLGISIATLGRAGNQPPPPPASVLGWAPGVPPPPASFGFKPQPEPAPHRGGPVWSLASQQEYLAKAIEGAAALL